VLLLASSCLLTGGSNTNSLIKLAGVLLRYDTVCCTDYPCISGSIFSSGYNNYYLSWLG